MRIRHLTIIAALLSFAAACSGSKDPFAAPPDVAAPPADAVKTASGLAYKALAPALRTLHPGLTSTVTVSYTGWTTDGKMFDSSESHPEMWAPGTKGVSMRVDGVIPGWTEALQMMSPSEKWRVWIPGRLGYGDGPSSPGGPPTGMLVFDIQLLRIQ